MTTTPASPGADGQPRRDHLLPNAWLVAKRELGERVRSRIFFLSTLLLAALAVAVALTPVLVRLADRGTTTSIAVVSDDAKLATSATSIMSGILNSGGDPGAAPQYAFPLAGPADSMTQRVADGEFAGALIISRGPTGQLSFRFLTGESLGADRVQLVNVAALAVGIFDWISQNRPTGASQFQPPVFDPQAVASGGGVAAAPIAASEYAGRRIVGVVFVVLIFITLVIYGMWVAAGVVSEKSSRVMELLISAASPAQLVVGKVVGIGLAGLVQYVAILVPALLTLLAEDRIAAA